MSPLRALSCLTLLLGPACAGDGDPGPAEDEPCASAPAATFLDVAYRDAPSSALTSLDVLVGERADSCAAAPVVVWVHGGAWATGDKANGMSDKRALFNGLGYLLVSVNYRLSPNPPAPQDDGRVMHPTHAQDVAAALAWVTEHIDEYGGDPTRITLLGHSAGAHLCALVGTDPSYLAAHGLGLSSLRCVGSLDTEAYDIPRALASASLTQRIIYENAFGTDAGAQLGASPQAHVAAGRSIPPFLLASRGGAERRDICADFAGALVAAGTTADVIDASAYSHEEVNDRIGAPGETTMTPPVISFLRGPCAFP